MNPSFWKGRRVLLTGHTGFKGAWATALLSGWGAEITAGALPPESDPNLWSLIEDRLSVKTQTVDLRNRATVAALLAQAEPEIVFHMAAQAQVRSSYNDPTGTFASNVMGTVHLLEEARHIPSVKTILVVTSDKVYANPDDGTIFSERAPLGGSDPYSASKAATEIATKSYAESFFIPRGITLATARGGNVVGGGDFSSDRLVPDLYRAARSGTPVELRYPEAHRPWQHVLDCLSGYLTYIEHLSSQKVANPAALNFGPSSEETYTVAQLADVLGKRLGNAKPWRHIPSRQPEKQALRLTATLARQTLGWKARLDLAATIDWTADWYARFADGEDALVLTRRQIDAFLDLQ